MMGFGLKGRVDWKVLDKDSLEVLDSGYEENIILDLGRKHFLGGWMESSSPPAIVVASGTVTPDHEDTAIDTVIAYTPNVPAGTPAATVTWDSPTVSYESTFQSPPEDYTVNKVGLGRHGQKTGSIPNVTWTKPYCVVKLSTPITWPTLTLLNIRYRVTIEKYAED